jgi:membrane protein DedA with SNARE-associated domain
MGRVDSTILDGPQDWIVALLHQQAYLAPFLLVTVEEAGIPLPVPGDLVIMYIGYQVSKGVLPYAHAFVLLLLAVLVGSSILYALSARYGQRIVLHFGNYLHLDAHKLLTVEEKFQQYGPWVIILGRHIPGFRIPITIFAGMSGIA